MSGEFPRDFSVSAELGLEAETLAIGMLAHGRDWALHRVATFEDRLSTYTLELDVTNEDQRKRIMKELHTGLAVYHEALPLDEAERRWLSPLSIVEDEILGRRERPIERFIVDLRAREATIVSAGLIKAINGEEIYQRWSSWYTREGKFTGSPGLGAAYRGLHRVCSLLQPHLADLL